MSKERPIPPPKLTCEKCGASETEDNPIRIDNRDRTVCCYLDECRDRIALQLSAMKQRAETAERDAYKKAKAENDERFMRERDEARAELADLDKLIFLLKRESENKIVSPPR